MKPVSEVAAAGRSRIARVRRLLWRGAGGWRTSADVTAARAVGRVALFTLLAVSLVGTLMTAVYLPAPWGRLVVLPAALGALCAGAGACLYVFLLSLTIVEVVHRRAASAASFVKRRAAPRGRAGTPTAPEPK
ncbi:hypothetical protein ACODT5_01285 [Streptomyces sp. 5.8]|uniref:hypothetical protein n=1 Tax=Streptomyces sp. 5.8 TaxID=3406571 RepID=UPI003BB4D012